MSVFEDFVSPEFLKTEATLFWLRDEITFCNSDAFAPKRTTGEPPGKTKSALVALW